MDKSIRINFVLNGVRELDRVVDNLRQLFEFEDPMLLITKSEASVAKKILSEKLNLDDKWFEENAYCEKFNKVDYDEIKSHPRKLYLIKMPNSLYHSIPTAFNDGFKFVDSTSVARFIHVFADDCKIVSNNYEPARYEWFMDNFSVPFVMDSKMNPGNYAFRKYSPRFIFMSNENLKSPISFAQFESKDHFIIDRDVLKMNFDEKVKRLYMPEFVMRLRSENVIKHTSFYPDPIIERWFERDNGQNPIGAKEMEERSKEYFKDEKYIKETLKSFILVENKVEPIISELVEVIKKGLHTEISINGGVND